MEHFLQGVFQYNVYNDFSFIESGSFSITKFGSLGNPKNNDTTVVIIGGNNNSLEEDFQYFNTHPDPNGNPSYDFSIANNFRYGTIGEINANYNTWYIAQANEDYIENNAYNIGVALDSIISLTTPKEIHLVAHSFGGVQVRTMLGNGGRKLDGNYEIPNPSVIAKIKTVTFLSSPHLGIAVGSWSFIDGNASDEMKYNSYFITNTLPSLRLPNNIRFLNMTGFAPKCQGFPNFSPVPTDIVVDVDLSENPILMSTSGIIPVIQLYVNNTDFGCPALDVFAHSMTHHTDITSNISYSIPNDYSTLNRVFAFIRGQITASCITGIWTGNVSTDWTDGGNWSCGIVPNSTNKVIIPSGTSFPPIISNGISVSCRSLTLMPGVVVTVGTNAHLNVLD